MFMLVSLGQCRAIEGQPEYRAMPVPGEIPFERESHADFPMAAARAGTFRQDTLLMHLMHQ
jgi:hypothetical protein